VQLSVLANTVWLVTQAHKESVPQNLSVSREVMRVSGNNSVVRYSLTTGPEDAVYFRIDRESRVIFLKPNYRRK